MLAHDADSKQLSEHSEKPLEEGECLSEGTRAVLAEFDAMKEYPERYRRCRSFDEMLQDVLAGKWGGPSVFPSSKCMVPC
jgi:hypothetical protein